MSETQQNGNGGNGAVKIQYLPSDNLVERFATRWLRRELFEALRDEGFRSNTVPDAQLVMFGSGVVQLYRPDGGFPVSRQAKDLDLGFVMPPHASGIAREVPAELKRELEDHLANIARKLNAHVEIDADDHMLYINKAYSPEALLERTKGKREHECVEPGKDVIVRLEIPNTYFLSPLLPVKAYGDKGFYHEDVREVLAAKLLRMTGPKASFVVRDVIDFYNMLAVGELDLKRDAELLRTIGLAYIGSVMAANMYYESTLASLAPTDANVDRALRELQIDVAHKEGMREVYRTVHDAVRTIFLPGRGSLEPKLAGELGMTVNELNFVTRINGVEHLPGGRGMRPTRPEIDAGLIVSAGMEQQFPGLQNRVASKHELTSALNRAQADCNRTEQIPSFDDGF